MGIFNNSKSKASKWATKKAAPKAETTGRVIKTDKVKPVSEEVVRKPVSKTTPVTPEQQKVSNPIGAPDPDTQFQIMYGLLKPDGSIPGSTTPETAPVTPAAEGTRTVDVTPAKGTSSVDGTQIPLVGGVNTFTKSFLPKTVYKRLVNKKLTIILVENTATVAGQKDKVLQIVENFVRSDLLCIINYGATVNASEILDVSNRKDLTIMYDEGAGEESHLYDALIELEKIVSDKYLKTEEKETERVSIDSVDVIGIGTCRDTGSTASKEDALDKFHLLSLKSKVVTKYYCLTDAYFIGAAEIGFHSIGAISNAYQ